jgi:hypothetical protein
MEKKPVAKRRDQEVKISKKSGRKFPRLPMGWSPVHLNGAENLEDALLYTTP